MNQSANRPAASGAGGPLDAVAFPPAMAELAEAMEQLAHGNVTVVVPGLGRTDALGRMAAAVEHFKAEAIKKIKRKAKEEEDIKRWQEEEAERLAREKKAAREDQIAIDHLAAGLAKLAGGDLTFRIDTIFAPKTEGLRNDFNKAVETLRQTMRRIGKSSKAIHLGGGEISSAAEDLSRRTEQQAASLEETAATLDQITATVKNMAHGAIAAQNVVTGAKSDAAKSGEVAQKAIAAMDGIEASSRRIGQIIGVIDEIAFQTNILALNAGVEAARAGDAGRGFAVIAAEVRDLAGRSAGAAKEIKSLISASAAEVTKGVALVGETSKALGRIVAQVAEIDAAVSGIAESAQEQASALHQINAAVNQMDQVTQQNAAMVEESTAAAQILDKESEELARLVDQFQAGPESTGGPAEHDASLPETAARASLCIRTAPNRNGALASLRPCKTAPNTAGRSVDEGIC